MILLFLTAGQSGGFNTKQSYAPPQLIAWDEKLATFARSGFGEA
jgi:hypothetical protein